MKKLSTTLCCCAVAAGCCFAASSADSKFAMAAAHGGQAEVDLGKLASEKASDPAVKAFGQQMVEDHGKLNDKLMSVAQSENMTLPSDMDMKQKATYDKLKMLSGSSFDKAYVNDMLKDHEEDIKDFNKEANTGSDPKIKEFASESLPVLQGHLDKIKAIHAKMMSSAGGM